MSQPPPNFDPTATLLPRVDAPISVQTGGGYYDTKVSEETEQVENTKKITQSGGDFTADEKALLAKYSIGPKLQAQIGETTLREFIQQIQSPKCSAGAGAGILLHKDCWAVQAVITHLLRASLPSVVRKSNIDADIRYQSIPVSDTIDLSMEGFGAMFSKGASVEEGKLPEPTKLFLKQKELYQLVEKIPFMAIQVLLRGEIKQATDIPATMEIQKKVEEVQQFKKDRDAMMKKVAEGKVLISQLEKIFQEKRAKTPGPAVPTVMNDYISDITHSKNFFQEFEDEFQDSKILSFEIIQDFKIKSNDVNEHIRQLEKEKRAIDPSFFQKISQKIKPSDEVKHIQETYKVLVSKEEKIDYLHNLQSKGIFPGFPFDTIIQDYTNASYSQNARDHLYFESIISQLKYLEEMDSEENKRNIPFKTLYNDCIERYSAIQDIPTLQEVYDRMNNIETASIELLRATNQLEDLTTRVNMVIEKIEEEKKGIEKKVGGAIDKTKDILPQLNDITEEAYEIKEEIEARIGVNGNPGTAEIYDESIEDLIVLLKGYNTRISDLQKDLNEALSILNPSFAIFKKKTDLQTKITEEIKVDISKTKKSELLEVLGSDIQELLSTLAKAFFSEAEVKKYTGFYNSSLVENKSKEDIESAYNFYITIFTKANEILRWNIPENITKAREGVPQLTPFFILLRTFEEKYSQQKAILERLLHQVLEEFPQDQAVYMTTINAVYTEMNKLLGFISDILEIKEKTVEYTDKIPVDADYDKIKQDFPQMYIQKISSTDTIPTMTSFVTIFQRVVSMIEKYNGIQESYSSLKNARVKAIVYTQKSEFDNKFTQIINQYNTITESTTTLEQISDFIDSIRPLFQEFDQKYNDLTKRLTRLQLLDKTDNIEKTQQDKINTHGNTIESNFGPDFFSPEETDLYTHIFQKIQEGLPAIEQTVLDGFVNTFLEIFEKSATLSTKNVTQDIQPLLENIDQTSPVHGYITNIQNNYNGKIEGIKRILHDIVTLISPPNLDTINVSQDAIQRIETEIAEIAEKITKLSSIKKDVLELYGNIEEDIYGGEVRFGIGEIFKNIQSDEDIPKIREFLSTIQRFFQSYNHYSEIQADFEKIQNREISEEIGGVVTFVKNLFNEILNSLRTTFEQPQNLMELFGDDARKTTFIARIETFNNTIQNLFLRMGQTLRRNKQTQNPQTTKPFIEKQIRKLSPGLQARYRELLEDAEFPNQIIEVGQMVYRAIEYESTKKDQQERIQKQIETIQSLGKKLGINFAEIDRDLGIAPTRGGTRKKRTVIKKKKATRKQYGGNPEDDKRKLIELYKQLRKAQEVIKKEDIPVEKLEETFAYLKGPMVAELPKLEEIQKRVDISGFQKFKSWFSKKEKDIAQTTQQVQQDLGQGAPPGLQATATPGPPVATPVVPGTPVVPPVVPGTPLATPVVPPVTTATPGLRISIPPQNQNVDPNTPVANATPLATPIPTPTTPLATPEEIENVLQQNIEAHIQKIDNKHSQDPLYYEYAEQQKVQLRDKIRIPTGISQENHIQYIPKLLQILEHGFSLVHDINITQNRFENDQKFKTNLQKHNTFLDRIINIAVDSNNIIDEIISMNETNDSKDTIDDYIPQILEIEGRIEELKNEYEQAIPEIEKQDTYHGVHHSILLLPGDEGNIHTLRGRFMDQLEQIKQQHGENNKYMMRGTLIIKTQYTDIGENVYYARIYISKIEELKEKVMRYMENYEGLRKQFQKIQTNTKSNVRKDQIQAVNATYNELRDILIILQRDLTTQNITNQEIYETLHTIYDQYDELLKQLWPYREPSFKEKMKKAFTRRNSNVVIGNLPSPYIPKDRAGNPKEINQDHLRLLNEVQELYNQRRSEFQRIKDTDVIYPKNLEHIIIQYRVMLDQIGSTLYKNKKIGDTFQNYLRNIQPVLQDIIPPIFQKLERFYELSTEAKTHINTSVLFQAIYRDNLQEIGRLENKIEKMSYPYKNKKGELVFSIDFMKKYLTKMDNDLNDILNTMNTIHHRVMPPPPPPATTVPPQPIPRTREEALKVFEYQEMDNPSDAQIKKNYRKYVREHHPNKGGRTEDFQIYQAAYAILTGQRGGRKKTRRNRKTASKKKSRKQGRK